VVKRREDHRELVALRCRRRDRADGVAVLHEVERRLTSMGRVPEEPEPDRPVGEGEPGGGEEGDVRLPEPEPRRRLPGGDAPPPGLAGAVEPRHPPGAGVVALGRGRRGLAPGEGLEELAVEGVRGFVGRSAGGASG
jgi:hypothetical protein